MGIKGNPEVPKHLRRYPPTKLSRVTEIVHEWIGAYRSTSKNDVDLLRKFNREVVVPHYATRRYRTGLHRGMRFTGVNDMSAFVRDHIIGGRPVHKISGNRHAESWAYDLGMAKAFASRGTLPAGATHIGVVLSRRDINMSKDDKIIADLPMFLVAMYDIYRRLEPLADEREHAPLHRMYKHLLSIVPESYAIHWNEKEILVDPMECCPFDMVAGLIVFDEHDDTIYESYAGDMDVERIADIHTGETWTGAVVDEFLKIGYKADLSRFSRKIGFHYVDVDHAGRRIVVAPEKRFL